MATRRSRTPDFVLTASPETEVIEKDNRYYLAATGTPIGVGHVTDTTTGQPVVAAAKKTPPTKRRQSADPDRARGAGKDGGNQTHVAQPPTTGQSNRLTVTLIVLIAVVVVLFLPNAFGSNWSEWIAPATTTQTEPD